MKPEDVTIKTKEELKKLAKHYVSVLESFLPMFTKETDPTGWLYHETSRLAGNCNFMGKKVTNDIRLRHQTQQKLFEAKMWAMALNFCPENKS